jgi:prepilin-type N-terminal cleavage/methylation domain-containing protein
MGKTKSSGFTLIELLIVIGIISLLAAALLPNILSGREKANIFADQANLRWHFPLLMQLRDQKKMPTRGGCKFVVAPWYRGLVDKTQPNFDRYFNPEQSKEDAHYMQLLETGIDKIWPNEGSITSQDTHYAGRSEKFFPGMAASGNEAWVADDCEITMPFPKGSINVLYADGQPRELLLDPELNKHGYTEKDLKDGKTFLVGPGSPHPDLAKLEK